MLLETLVPPFQSFTEGEIIPLIGIPRRKIQQSTFSCCSCVVVQVPGGRGRLVCLVLTERQNIAAAFVWMLQVRPVLPACKSTRCACEKVKWSRPLAAVPDTLTDGGSAWSQTIAAEFLGSMDDAGRAERRSDMSFSVVVVVAAASVLQWNRLALWKSRMIMFILKCRHSVRWPGESLNEWNYEF